MMFYKYLALILKKIYNIPASIIFKIEKRRYGYIAKNATLGKPFLCTCPEKIFLYEESCIWEGALFLISSSAKDGRFIVKRTARCAQNLTVITGNHTTKYPLGTMRNQNHLIRNGDIDKDIIIEEEAWLGANVTLLSGAIIGRGAIIGAGSVIRKKVPPYSIVIGNPAKVISFVFTPEEIIEHEKLCYNYEERYDYNVLLNNYNNYYVNKERNENILQYV